MKEKLLMHEKEKMVGAVKGIIESTESIAEEAVYLKEELDRFIIMESDGSKIIKFKTERQRKEFEVINLRLKIILLSLAAFLKYYYDYTLTVTELIRTQEEQDDIYKDYPDYLTTPWKSVHQDKRGADIRSVDMSDKIKKASDIFLNHFIYTGSKYKSRLSHNVGRGEHVHIQIDYDSYTSISEKGEDEK